MSEQHNCPICHHEMEMTHLISYKDYYCRGGDEHFYGKRVKNNVLTKLKIRFKEVSGEKIYIKFNYDLNSMQVWSKKPGDFDDSRDARIPIEGTFEPDFSDINKLKSKIKVYLTFS